MTTRSVPAPPVRMSPAIVVALLPTVLVTSRPPVPIRLLPERVSVAAPGALNRRLFVVPVTVPLVVTVVLFAADQVSLV